MKIKNTRSLMDKTSVYKVEDLGFDFYWAQVSVGGFLDYAYLSLPPPWGNRYDSSASFKKKKNPHPVSALCGILGVSFKLFCMKPFTMK